MLVPHRREDAKLGEPRRAADQLADALVLVGFEAVGGDERGGDFRRLGYAAASAGLAGWQLLGPASRRLFGGPRHKLKMDGRALSGNPRRRWFHSIMRPATEPP